MIISKTPLRLSFFGGGSDLPAFYQENRAAVLSTSIDKYVYVTVNKKFDDEIRVSYSKTEEVKNVSELQHQLVRAALNYTKTFGGVEITTVADIPSRGTGLGSSSSFTVALLHALYAFKGKYVSQKTLAEQACEIEIDICHEPIGKQDQYAAAFGGLKFYEFENDGSVKASPIICSPYIISQIQDHILMLYTGITRSASGILKEQKEVLKSDEIKKNTMTRMVDIAYELRKELETNNINSFGEALHEAWMLKRSLTSEISNDLIDGWYLKARENGAVGGKILGAGAGGFLALFAPPAKHQAICHVLPELKRVPVAFDRQGSQIIFYQ